MLRVSVHDKKAFWVEKELGSRHSGHHDLTTKKKSDAMNLNDGLVGSLKHYLPLNKSRLSCLCGILLSLLRLKQVNLTQLALAFSSEASLQSRYRRLQRFFAEVVFNYDHIAHLIMSLFDFEANGYYLALDRTNWQWGKTNINLLTLAVVDRKSVV